MKRNLTLITGGTSGIGFSTAKKIALKGNDLLLIYRNDSINAQSAVEEIKKINPLINVTAHKIDLCDLNGVEDLLSLLNSTYQKHRLEHFISCHGQIGAGLFLQKKFGSILSVVNEHLISNIKIVHGILQRFCVQKFGRVVFITSLASHKINQGQTDYALSKSALETFVKSLTSEYFQRKVTFNCICAGLVDTRATQDLIDGMNKGANVVPVDEVSDLILFLCSHNSNSISGSTFTIDGGQQYINNNLGYHRLSYHAQVSLKKENGS